MSSEGQNILLGIINQLRSGADLSRISLPTFILERKSMLERITNQLQHQEILIEAQKLDDPVQRFVNVVKWYLAGWHITPKAVKKPLNPVLGEHFSCYWELPNDTKAYYVSEQTSHHPPKSSYFYMSPENHIRVDGTLIPKSRFLGNSVGSMMEGIAYLQFTDKHDKKGEVETYELTQPNMYARGVLIGTLKYEMGDHLYVKCPGNDLVADIEFKTKGFISGTYNAIAGEIKELSTGNVLYEITGKWNEVMEIKDVKTGKKSEFFNAEKAKPLPPRVRSIEEQGDRESRKLWKGVTDALTARDHNVATNEKWSVEEQQRKEAKKREEDGVEFHPKLFAPTDSPLEFKIYKTIDGETVQEQIEQISSICPILPGQQFHEKFHIPAFQKKSSEKSGPSSDGPLNSLNTLEQSLPSKGKDEEAEEDDEFVDAESEID